MVKKLIFILLLVAIIIFTPFIAKQKTANANPLVQARAAVLMDAATGKLLFCKNSRAIMAPASTTKIMTAVLVLERLNLAKAITVYNPPLEGTSMDLTNGERKTVRELLYGLMMVSGNDAATILAKAVSGSETKFAKLMTEKARLIGMKNTVFKNASGLPVIGHANLHFAAAAGDTNSNEKWCAAFTSLLLL